MRLRKLSLDRFGHFTDKQIDFGSADDAPDFHIVYGPNEAGKTTTMEAALRLFYGFPQRESYDFKHQRKNLQVSGQLEAAGALHHFTRLPKRSGALCDGQGTPLPETSLSSHLAGLSLDDYRKLLCLDDETIERGGDEIARAEGDIGRLLFSAAAGIADLSAVLTEVRETASQLWRKRASKTEIAALKNELKEVDSEIKLLDISAKKWSDLKKQLTQAQQTESECRESCNRYRLKALTIDAHRRALPKLRKIASLSQHIAEFSNYPVQLDFDPEELVTLQNNEAQLSADISRLSKVIEDTRAQIDNLERTPALVALSEQLDDLDSLRARDVTAGQDIERRRKDMQSHLTKMQNAARDLGADAAIDPHDLVLSSTDIQKLTGLRDALRSANATLDTDTRELAELTERCEQAALELNTISAQSAGEPAFSKLLTSFDAEHLSTAYTGARQSIAAAEQAATRAISALTIGQIRFDTLPVCSATTTSAREHHEKHIELKRQISEKEGMLAQHEQDAQARRAQINKMESDRSLVSDAQAGHLKAEREQRWQTHRENLTDQTAQHFESAMRLHDEATESRVMLGSELGQLRQTELSLIEAQTRADSTRAELAELTNRITAVETEVGRAASAVNLPPTLTPAEWLQWMQLYDDAAEKTKDSIQTRQQHQATTNRMQQLHEALCTALNVPTAEDIDAVLSQARIQAEAERTTSADIKAAESTLKALETDRAKRQQRLQKAEDQKLAAEQAWLTRLSGLPCASVVQESLLQSLDPLRALRKHSDDFHHTAQRVEAMQQDQTQFREELNALCKTHNLPMESSAADTFLNLRAMSRQARDTETKASHLTEKLEKAIADHETTTQELERLYNRVRTIGSIFPAEVAVDSLEPLRKAAMVAKQVINERNERHQLEREVLEEMEVDSVAQARDILDNTSDSDLLVEEEDNKVALIAAEKQLEQAIEARTLAEKALSDISGDAEIATLNERRAAIELKMEDTATHYLTLTLGHTLADTAIKRYRDSHRSDMMSATERCFAALTNNAYPQLTTQPEAGKEILLAVNKEGTSKQVDALSKGTRFQLYLALRAAAYEQLINQGTSLPFFCDDIFETFDETRTSAACQVMEQIGTKGQAIYLTHHQHVVDIALQVCNSAPQVHRI